MTDLEQARWDDDRRRIKGARTFEWPDPAALDPQRPVLFVRVTTPGDQAALHAALGSRGYYPTLYGEDESGAQLFRFTIHDGQLR